MKRVYTSIVLLAIVLTLNFSSLIYIHSTVNELNGMLAQIKSSVKNEDYDSASKEVSAFCDTWHQKEKLLVRIMRHQGIDSAENSIEQLPVLLEYREYAMFMSNVSLIEAIITRMWEDEVPNIKNIM